MKAAKVCEPPGISASLLPAQVAYAFRTPMACAGGAVRSQLHVASLSDATMVRATPCGSEGLSCVLLGAMREEKSLVIARSKEGPYGVFPFDADKLIPTDLDLVLANAVGELCGDTLASVRRHAEGTSSRSRTSASRPSTWSREHAGTRRSSRVAGRGSGRSLWYRSTQGCL